MGGGKLQRFISFWGGARKELDTTTGRISTAFGEVLVGEHWASIAFIWWENDPIWQHQTARLVRQTGIRDPVSHILTVRRDSFFNS
jgi:hypothetical protein